jgi:hypothetical protein
MALYHLRCGSPKNETYVEVKLDGKVERIPMSKYSKKGTFAHGILSKIFEKSKLTKDEITEFRSMLEKFQNLRSEVEFLSSLKKTGTEIAVEDFRACIFDNHTITGTFDLIAINHNTRKIYIYDWKTGSRNAKLDEFQLKVYASILIYSMALAPYTKYAIVLKDVYFKTDANGEVKLDKTCTVDFLPSDTRFILSELVSKAGRPTIEYLNAEVSPTRNCNMCEYQNVCAKNKLREIVQNEENII